MNFSIMDPSTGQAQGTSAATALKYDALQVGTRYGNDQTTGQYVWEVLDLYGNAESSAMYGLGGAYSSTYNSLKDGTQNWVVD